MGVIIRQGFKSTVSNYIGVFIGFISSFYLLPLFYSANDLGIYRMFIEVATVLSAFSMMGTNYSINRFFPHFRTQDQKHHGFFFWAFLFPLIGLSILLVLLSVWGTEIFNFINPKALQLGSLFPSLLLLILIFLFQNIIDVSCANHGRVAFINFLKEIIMRLLVIVCGYLFFLQVTNFTQSIYLLVISYAIIACASLFFLSRLTRINLIPDLNFIKTNTELKKEIGSFTVFLILFNIMGMIIPKIDLFVLSNVKKDFAQVAIYSIGFTLATFIEIPKRTIIQIATPVFAGLMKAKKYQEADELNKKNATNLLILSGILFFGIWINIDTLYHFMPKGDFFSQGKWVVFYIGIARLLEAVFSGNSPILANSTFFFWTLANTMTAGLLGIAINYFMIKEFGLTGGAISTIFVAAIGNLINFFLIRKKLKISPLHHNQIKLLFVLTLFFGISFIGPWITNPLLDSIVRSLTLIPALMFIIFKLEISVEINTFIKDKAPRVYNYLKRVNVPWR